jgi:hypothetical protein
VKLRFESLCDEIAFLTPTNFLMILSLASYSENIQDFVMIDTRCITDHLDPGGKKSVENFDSFSNNFGIFC